MPSPDAIKRMRFPGFDLTVDGADCRVDYIIPEPLEGKVWAALLCRGTMLEGTRGIPSMIFGRIGRLLGGSRLLAPWQVHGTALTQGRKIWTLPQRVKADGVHLDRSFDERGTVIGSLRFADCAPILIASSVPRPWIVMLHSGFKGTLFDIFGTAWRRIVWFYEMEGRAIDPLKTFAWVGPAIGPCCFTRSRSEDLAIRAEKEWSPWNSRRDGDYVRLDIAGEITGRIRSAGIPEENIMTLPLCTRCHSDKFYSYRAGDSDNRMILLAKLYM
jgi:copper oxidase (laccase) domain-containing protein